MYLVFLMIVIIVLLLVTMYALWVIRKYLKNMNAEINDEIVKTKQAILRKLNEPSYRNKMEIPDVEVNDDETLAIIELNRSGMNVER